MAMQPPSRERTNLRGSVGGRPTAGGQPDELRVERRTVRPDRPPSPLRERFARGLRSILESDRLVLIGLLVLAAATRLPGLAGRGRWEGDQGDEFMTLLRFVRDGVVPLLGPPALSGSFHHGAVYYYLLAPFAAISDLDPTALVAVIAAFGIATVGVTWWLARIIGGPLAGLVAGLFAALSPSAIEASTFLWNANLLPFFSALAIGCAWQGRRTGRPGLWTAALASAGMVAQLHILGALLLPPVVVLLALELGAARPVRSARFQRLALATLAGAAIIGLLYLPLLIHELQTGFLEVHRMLGAFAGGGGPATLDPLERLLLTGLRVVGWPIVGLITNVPLAATLAVSLVVGLTVWRSVTARGEDAVATRWLAGTVAWSAVLLTFAAPSLATVVAGLPNDHYHAFLDPLVIVLLAISATAFVQPRGLASVDVTARALLGIALLGLLAVSISRWPPTVDPNGGWQAAQTAGRRVVEATGLQPTAFIGLPTFETPDGTVFPFVRAGGMLVDDASTARFIVVPCDRLFNSILNGPCGGDAEDRLMRDLAAGIIQPVPAGMPVPVLVERFDLSPRIAVSIYRPG